MQQILVINPSTAYTRLAVFESRQPIFFRKVFHDAEKLSAYAHTIDQEDLRYADICKALETAGVALNFDVIICRGALIRPLESGTYNITEQTCIEARTIARPHPVNLGVLLAYRLAQQLPHCQAITANPGMVDERTDLARLSGAPGLKRTAVWHTLNQKAVAQHYATERGLRYENLSLIVCHLGMGVSIAAHHHGRAIDVNNALDGEGPFSPMRCGTLPVGDLVRLCFSGQYTKEELLEKVTKKGGLMAYFQTSDVEALAKEAENGNERCRLVLDAMIYQISKGIAAMGAVLLGQVDAIILTGDMAFSDYIVKGIQQRISYLAPVRLYPGDEEMQALAESALRHCIKHQIS